MLITLVLTTSALAFEFGDASSTHLFAGSGNALVSLDAGSEVAWRTELETMAGRSLGAPVLTPSGVIVSDGTRIHAVDATSGKAIWTAFFPLGESRSEGLSRAPIVDSGVVLSTKSYGLMGLDLKTGKELWSDGYSNGFSPPTNLGDGTALTIYETSPYEVWRVRIATGEVVSKAPLPMGNSISERPDTDYPGVVTAKGVAFCTRTGLVITDALGSNPKTVAHPIAMFGCAPSADNSRIVVHSKEGVVALDWQGKTLWKTPAKSQGTAAVLVGDFVAASAEESVIFLDPKDGAELHRQPVDWMFTSARIWKGNLLFADARANVTTIEPAPQLEKP